MEEARRCSELCRPPVQLWCYRSNCRRAGVILPNPISFPQKRGIHWRILCCSWMMPGEVMRHQHVTFHHDLWPRHFRPKPYLAYASGKPICLVFCLLWGSAFQNLFRCFVLLSLGSQQKRCLKNHHQIMENSSKCNETHWNTKESDNFRYTDRAFLHPVVCQVTARLYLRPIVKRKPIHLHVWKAGNALLGSWANINPGLRNHDLLWG